MAARQAGADSSQEVRVGTDALTGFSGHKVVKVSLLVCPCNSLLSSAAFEIQWPRSLPTLTTFTAVC